MIFWFSGAPSSISWFGDVSFAPSALVKRLSPNARDYLIGMSLAFDPLPEHRYETFYDSDAEALRSDWINVGCDLWMSHFTHGDIATIADLSDEPKRQERFVNDRQRAARI